MSTDPMPGYTGVDNLEIMEEASNYNAFLQVLVTNTGFGDGSGVLDAAAQNLDCKAIAHQGTDVSHPITIS